MPKMNINLDKETDKNLEKIQFYRKYEEDTKTTKADLAVELIQKGIKALEEEQSKNQQEEE